MSTARRRTSGSLLVVALVTASSAGSPISSSRFVAASRLAKSSSPSCLTRRAISASSPPTTGTNGSTSNRKASQRGNQMLMFGSLAKGCQIGDPKAALVAIHNELCSLDCQRFAGNERLAFFASVEPEDETNEVDAAPEGAVDPLQH